MVDLDAITRSLISSVVKRHLQGMKKATPLGGFRFLLAINIAGFNVNLCALFSTNQIEFGIE